MKKINTLCIILTLLIISCENDNEGNERNERIYYTDSGIFTDTRDGQEYKWVEIGDQIWMAQNLNYFSENGSCICMEESDYEEILGVWYNWETACMVCPDGWHLPTNDEWIKLKNTLGGENNAAKVLCDTTGWIVNGNNLSGFSCLPAGVCICGLYPNHHSDDFAAFWTTTSYSDTSAVHIQLTAPSIFASLSASKSPIVSLSVRCVKDE